MQIFQKEKWSDTQASFSLFVNLCFFEESPPTILLPSGLKKSSSGLFAPDILPQQQQNKRTTSTFHNSSNPHCQSCDIFFLLGQGTSAQPQPNNLHYYRGPDPRSILGLVNKENIRVWAVDPRLWCQQGINVKHNLPSHPTCALWTTTTKNCEGSHRRKVTGVPFSTSF